MTWIVWPADAATRQDLGGKAAALAALGAADLPVPAWFAVTPAALGASLTDTARSTLEAACALDDGAAVETALAGLEPSPAVRDALACAVAALCPAGEMVAVRSSAVDEDSAQRSFAGQLDSFLCVPPDEVAFRVAGVWRSAFGERVLAYRRANDFSCVPPFPAVLVQRMVQAEAAGVAFSADPVTGQRGVAVVSAVHGLGAALVAGEVEGDTYRVDRAGQVVARAPAGWADVVPALRQRIGELDTDGRARAEVREEAPILSDEQVRAVAELARRCERQCGRPQDIEWAIAGGQLALLQARPITTLAHLADPDGAYNLWDNSNIAESYSGVTTPLTFSFARHAYEQVYRQLVRVLGAPEAVIVEHDNTFRNMIGLVHGRVFYNLLSWYRLLALLPGFTINHRFMEQMMGVKEGLPEIVLTEVPRANWRARLNDSRRFAIAVAGLATNYLRLPRHVRCFYLRLDEALGDTAPNLSGLRPDELVAYYRNLERQLITQWNAPLLNDLFAMVFYGLLRQLAIAWCGDAAGTLQNDLLSGEGGMVSAEPAARVRELAALAARDADLVSSLCVGSLGANQGALAARPEFRAAYDAYLDKFADRCLEELKLESPTLRDDPLPLLRAVGHLAQRAAGTDRTIVDKADTEDGECRNLRRGRDAAGGEESVAQGVDIGGRTCAANDARPSLPPESIARGQSLRRRAERRVASSLAGRPLRGALFRWVLTGARSRVRDRENLRFERTRVFGRVRLIFVELGRRLHALDLLAEPRDIFYLEVEEALGFVEGTVTTTDLKALVALRQAEFARYRALEPPPERFVTYGIVYQGNGFQYAPSAADAGDAGTGSDRRQGIGCCPGVVRGRVRVVRDPKSAQLEAGEILVAERTDPGWIILFPSAAGVLVERGSLLSHSAIVARELGIPTVVALTGVTRWLADGDLVEMDGSAGTVTRVVSSADQPSGQEREVPSHA
jgi:pyruvate,water dikinase